jgi:urease accessory protein
MRAIAIKRATTWTERAADHVVLDHHDRHRRRLAMEGANGLAFLLDLPNQSALCGGDALVLEDGRLIEIIAAREPLMEIHCRDARHLARLAWHLGNRHCPAQLMATSLRVQRDHVIADMAEQLGARLSEIEAPFEPEAGAYAAAAAHAHDHDHDHERPDRDATHVETNRPIRYSHRP